MARDADDRFPALRWVGAAALVVAVAAGVAAFFLAIYPAKELRVPVGWDTSRYLWRTALAAEVGVSHLADAVPNDVRADPSRPAFPIVAGTLASAAGISPFRVAAVLPGVMAGVVGLTAGAFVAAALRRSAWELAAVAVGVGTSAFLVRLAGPETYQDNLFAAAAFLAAMTALALSIEDRRALLPAVVLFGAGGAIHWAFFGFMFATLALPALVLLPASWRRWRGGRDRALETPTGRVAMVAGGGAAIAAATIFGVLGTGTRGPKLSETEFEVKLNRDLPKYRLPVMLPLAAGGGLAVASQLRNRPPHPERVRFVLILLVSWCAVAAAGLASLAVLDLSVPGHRFLAFALAVPVLAVLGVLWLGGLVGRLARPLGALLVVGVLGVSVFASHLHWFDTRTWMDPRKVEEALLVNDYLDAAGIGPDRPVVVLIRELDPSYAGLMTNMARAALPPDRIRQLYFYAGSPDDYLARRPTLSERPVAATTSARYFEAMRDTYDRDPVAVIPKSYNGFHFNPWAKRHPDTVVAGSIAVVRGPTAEVDPVPPPAPLTPMGPGRVALLGAGVLVALFSVGSGWTVALFRRWVRPAELLALVPAVGVGALVMVGIVLDRLGLRFAGTGGRAILAAAATLGWVAAAISVTRARRPTRRADVAPAPVEPQPFRT